MNESTHSPAFIRIETTGELTLRITGVLLLIAAGFIEIVGLASNDPPPVGSLVFLILGGFFMIYGRLTQIARVLAEQRQIENVNSNDRSMQRTIRDLHRLPA
ncbi:hypothetical protein [Lacipirellula sp.]|uniref:hypothetical protein n=1 Tax=Lacipirellula sp. TaxID=2691419 RepID=UPI003D0F77C2